ncbi:MAG: hypothetical protein ACOX1Q_09650 [Eubacteriales bacterium]
MSLEVPVDLKRPSYNSGTRYIFSLLVHVIGFRLPADENARPNISMIGAPDGITISGASDAEGSIDGKRLSWGVSVSKWQP